MTVIEVINTIDFWFGLATGVACHKIAGNILKEKLSTLLTSKSDTKEE